MTSKQNLALDCYGCVHFEECKTQLKACELYHNKIEGISTKDAATSPSFKWFDRCEDQYRNIATTTHTRPLRSTWLDASSVYESSVSQKLGVEFKSDIDSWKWLYARKANKLVGAIGYEDVKQGTSIINFLFVRNHYRGQGIGTLLINELFLDEQVLLVSADYASDTFYEKLGFRLQDSIHIRD